MFFKSFCTKVSFTLLILLCFCFNANTYQGQLKDVLSNEMLMGVASGWNESNFSENIPTEGSPNLFSSWMIGNIMLIDGKEVTNIKCNYDADKNAFMVVMDLNLNQINVLNSDIFNSFIYKDLEFKPREYRRGGKEDFEEEKEDFFIYEVLLDQSGLVVAKVVNKKYKPMSGFARPGDRQNKWASYVSYYYSRNESVFKKFKMNKKGLSSFLEKDFVSQTQFMIKSNSDVFWTSDRIIFEFITKML